MTDPIVEFEHTHGRLSELVLELTRTVAAARPGRTPTETEWRSFSHRLDELREQLLLYFAREEEGLLPYLREHMPMLRARADQLVAAHDTICGTLVRLTHMVANDGRTLGPNVLSLFDRFESAYREHAREE